VKLDPKSPNKKQSYETAQKKICPIPAMSVNVNPSRKSGSDKLLAPQKNKKKEQQHQQAYAKALQYYSQSTGSACKLPKTR